MKELAPGIVVFDNIFPDSMDFIKEIARQDIQWRPAEVGIDDKTSGVKTSARDTDIIVLQDTPDILGDLTRSFRSHMMPCLIEYRNLYGAGIEEYQDPQLLRYGLGQKFIDHIDDSPRLTRRISLTYYLNDDYEGGDVEFRRFGLRFKAQKNQLLLFPSNFVYNHQVHPVTDGLRYVIVQWMA
jgi:hypothetical protein